MPPQAQKFHGFPDHLRIQHSQTSAAVVLACRSAETPVSTTAVEVVCKLRQGFALAENLRSLPYSRLRGDAAADSGGSGDPQVSSNFSIAIRASKRLARAPVKDVKKLWYPLGYNIRPERLHSIACETVERYGGKLPSDQDELLSFKGIGRYTAGAIRSFAFNEDAPILDTNVIRVLYRVFIAKGDPKTQKAKLWQLAEALIPRGKGYDFNQAMMDFGAICCTARTPSCQACPMKAICKTYPFKARGKSVDGESRRSGRRLDLDDGRYLDRQTPHRRASWPAYGSFPAGNVSREKPWKNVCGGSCSKS